MNDSELRALSDEIDKYRKLYYETCDKYYNCDECDVKNFMDWMYKDANLYMNRKFEIYLNKFYSKNN